VRWNPNNLQFVEDGLVQQEFLDEGILFGLLFSGHLDDGLDNFLLDDLDLSGDGVNNLVDLFVEEGVGVDIHVVLEFINVNRSLQQILEDFLQVHFSGLVDNIGGGGDEWGLDTLSIDSTEWVHFLGLSGQKVQDILVIHILVDHVVVHVLSIHSIDLWVDGLDGVKLVVVVEELIGVHVLLVVVVVVEHVDHFAD